jgi:hypothetical protein
MAVKVLIVAVAVWAIYRTIFDPRNKLPDHQGQPWTLHPGWLLVSGLLYSLGILPEGLFWHRALRSLGQQTPLGRTLRAYYIGHLGKYVPGKAMVVVMRTGMVCGPGVDTSIAAASVFLETLTMMASGAFLAAVLLIVHDVRHAVPFWAPGDGAAAGGSAVFGWFSVHGFSILLSLAMLGATGLPTLPPVFARMARLFGVGRSDPIVAAKLAQFRYGTLAWGWVLMFVGWAFIGASLWATLRAFGVADMDLLGQLPLYVAATGLAMVAGFVSMVPSGLAVRELVLIQSLLSLSPQMNREVALAVTVVLRLVWLAAEVVISVILFLGPIVLRLVLLVTKVVISAILYLGWRVPHAFHRHSGLQ